MKNSTEKKEMTREQWKEGGLEAWQKNEVRHNTVLIVISLVIIAVFAAFFAGNAFTLLGF